MLNSAWQDKLILIETEAYNSTSEYTVSWKILWSAFANKPGRVNSGSAARYHWQLKQYRICTEGGCFCTVVISIEGMILLSKDLHQVFLLQQCQDIYHRPKSSQYSHPPSKQDREKVEEANWIYSRGNQQSTPEVTSSQLSLAFPLALKHRYHSVSRYLYINSANKSTATL